MSTQRASTKTASSARSNHYNLASPRIPVAQNNALSRMASASSTSSSSSSTAHAADSRRPGATPFDAFRSTLNLLSDATGPKPRSKSKSQTPTDEDVLAEYYGLSEPPTLLYNGPPPLYEELYGPDPSQPVSSAMVIKTIARKVGQELVGGRR